MFLEPEEIEREANQMKNVAKKLYFTLKDKAPRPAEVAQLTLNDIERFLKTVPVMKVVSTKGLQ